MKRSVEEKYPDIEFDHCKASEWCRNALEIMYQSGGYTVFETMKLKDFRTKFCRDYLKRSPVEDPDNPDQVLYNMNADERHWVREIVQCQLRVYDAAQKREAAAVQKKLRVPRAPSTVKKRQGLDNTRGLILTACAIQRRQAQKWSKKELMDELWQRLGKMRSNGWHPMPRENKSLSD